MFAETTTFLWSPCQNESSQSKYDNNGRHAATRLGTPPQARDDAKDAAWRDEELLLIRLVDALHDAADISAWLWKALTTAFSTEQIFELIALVSSYHTVSFFAYGPG
jgi:hypothetical protein